MANSGTFTVTGTPNNIPTGGVLDIPVVVTGLVGPVSGVTIELDGVTHPDTLFLYLLLVGPDNPDGTPNLQFFYRSGNGLAITDQTLFFTDHPERHVTLAFPVLKPYVAEDELTGADFGLPGLALNYAGPWGTDTLATAFSGNDANGTWHLYVADDNINNGGGTLGSFNLTVVTNVAPEISAVDHLAVDQGSSLMFSAANGNLPTSVDPDADPGDFGKLRISVEHGTIQNDNFFFLSTPAKEIEVGTSLNGIMAAFFEELVYKPDPGFNGVDHLTIKLTDAGGLAQGGGVGELSDTKTIDIEVYAHQAGDGGDNSFTAAGYQKIDGGAGKDTVTFDFALTQATVSYVDSKLVVEGAGTKTVLTGIERFVFKDGTVENADGNPLVDDLFYYTHNHDVWAAHTDADAHYASFGWHENRDPNAYFDTKGYLDTYADVKAAGVNPLTHYDTFGWKEGRDPSTAFDTGDYLSHYADIAAAKVDPLAHFLLFGAAEGRTAFNDHAWG